METNITCGTDIIEIGRIKNLVDDAKGEAIEKIFTKNEIEYCESKNSMKYQHYAARFASKEAIFKAISNKLSNKFELSWNDVEVLNDINGRPEIKFIRKMPSGLKYIEISLSHCREFAVAMVIVAWEN